MICSHCQHPNESNNFMAHYDDCEFFNQHVEDAYLTVDDFVDEHVLPLMEELMEIRGFFIEDALGILEFSARKQVLKEKTT